MNKTILRFVRSGSRRHITGDNIPIVSGMRVFCHDQPMPQKKPRGTNVTGWVMMGS